METVQLQCGHCKQLMAIAAEHMGGQVRCPHCKGVLQTPPPTLASDAAPPAAAPMPNRELQQRESIFAGAEASEVVVGEQAAPKVELPPLLSSAPSVLADEPLAAEDSSPAPERDADL